MDTEQRRILGKRNKEWGHYCEQLAAEYFIKEGYIIRERNWKLGNYEIDLILEKDRTIVFVEVKARKEGTQDPISAVNKTKMKRLYIAADVYLRRFKILYQYRFDIMAITGDSSNYNMEHYPDAFMPSVNETRNRR